MWRKQGKLELISSTGGMVIAANMSNGNQSGLLDMQLASLFLVQVLAVLHVYLTPLTGWESSSQSPLPFINSCYHGLLLY